MRFVIGEFTIITLLEAVWRLKKQDTIDEPYLVMTFDDGYRSFLRIADYFKESEIPTILFITVSFIEKPGYLT